MCILYKSRELHELHSGGVAQHYYFPNNLNTIGESKYPTCATYIHKNFALDPVSRSEQAFDTDSQFYDIIKYLLSIVRRYSSHDEQSIQKEEHYYVQYRTPARSSCKSCIFFNNGETQFINARQ